MSYPIGIGNFLGKPPGTPGGTYQEKVLAILPANQIAYWPLGETEGLVAHDISQNNNDGVFENVVLGGPGIGDEQQAPIFDGTTSFVDVYSMALNSVYSGAEGTLAIWAKVSAAGDWTDATVRQIIRLAASTSNRSEITKTNNSNRVDFQYRAANVLESYSELLFSPTAWFHVALNWSKANEEVRYFVNGSKKETDINLGVYSGNLNNQFCCIGAFRTTPTQLWKGQLAHAVLYDVPLSDANILALATL